MDKIAFDTLALNDNKYQLDLAKYFCSRDDIFNDDVGSEKGHEEFLAHQKLDISIPESRIVIWEYLNKTEIGELLQMEKRSHIRKFIESTLKNPKGLPKIIFRELMYTVVKFCKSLHFTLEQAGAVMSQFYLTHLFFTSSSDVGAEKVYNYFKNLQLCHSLPFPPKSVKLFSLEETKCIMMYFCKLYLRNLPIIRLMSLPNFSLQVLYPLEPEFIPGKKKKGKKGDNKKKKK